jgi:nicotinamide mononucleotide transporter
MGDLPKLILEGLRAMSWQESVTVVTTLLCVLLTIRNSIWCWFWGVISVVLFGYAFWVSKLYSSMLLQIVYYLPMQMYGWWVWLRGGPMKANDLPVSTQSGRNRLVWAAANIPLAAVLGYTMSGFGARDWYWDALVTAMSVIGQYLMTHKKLENWIYWIVVNVIYAFYLFPKQKLYAYAALYVLLLGLAVMGLAEWMRQEAQARAETVQS